MISQPISLNGATITLTQMSFPSTRPGRKITPTMNSRLAQSQSLSQIRSLSSLLNIILGELGVQLVFIRSYREHMGLSESSDPLDSEEHIQLETNTFALANHLLCVVWSIYQGKHATIPFGYWVTESQLPCTFPVVLAQLYKSICSKLTSNSYRTPYDIY